MDFTFCTMICICIIDPPAFLSDDMPALTVTVKIAAKETTVLDLELVNKTKKSLRLREHDLPWVGAYSIILVATQDVLPPERLEPILTFDNPAVREVTLAPGQKLSGRIKLTDRFRCLQDSTKECDVIIFWYYKAESVDNVKLGRFGGWVRIPKHKAQ